MMAWRQDTGFPGKWEEGRWLYKARGHRLEFARHTPDAMSATPVILHYLHRDNFGGGPKNVVQVIDALAGMGEQHVVTAGFGRLTEQVKARPEVKRHTVADLSTVLFPVTALQLNAVLGKVKPQLVLTHGQWGGMFMGMALRMAAPTQAVFVTQWCSLYESRDSWRAARNWLAEWLAFSKHQHVVCASDGNVRQFLYAGLLDDRSQVTVIPNPTEPPVKSDPAAVARLTPPARVEGVKTFVFLGRLERQKRPDWLLQAWKRALDLGMKDARLLVLGEGSWRSRCESMVRDNILGDTVQLLGHRVDALAYLQSADGLLLTSLYEGHANVVLEAQAVGVPVLAMDADGVKESFTSAGQGSLVPLGDVAAFAKQLKKLADQAVTLAGATTGLSPEQHASAFRELVGKQLVRSS